jgi:hypothetical protein
MAGNAGLADRVELRVAAGLWRDPLASCAAELCRIVAATFGVRGAFQ